MAELRSPNLYSSLLLYIAFQAAFVSFLFSYYEVGITPVIKQVSMWNLEKLKKVSSVRNALDSAKNLVSSFNFLTSLDSSTEKRTETSPYVQTSSMMKFMTNNDGLPVFTREQLSLFDGTRPSKDVYLAFLGRVYDVQKGHKHYGSEGSYHFFAGKDATRSFITGEFGEDKLIDDVSDFSPQELLSLLEWSNFYEKEYELVGVVQGRFYDSHGQPSENLKQVLQLIEGAKHWKTEQVKESEVFPQCNSEWQKNSGRVWCSNKSGGIQRSWAGVPRKLFNPGSKTFRCACIKNFGPPLAKSASEEDLQSNRGDLNNRNLREYDNCSPVANSCKIQESS